MDCQFCRRKCIKKGKRNRRQIFKCLSCEKSQQSTYIRRSYSITELNYIVKLNNEGVSIRSISRILDIPKTSVSRLLFEVSKKVKRPIYIESEKEYEVDELRVKVAGEEHETWLCYAINRGTKEVIDFVVGRKTKANIKKVIDTVLILDPKKIYSDKLPLYKSLIPRDIHSTRFKSTNHIERKNLTLRTHLKRLNRKTICFSRSTYMLIASLRLYFWNCLEKSENNSRKFRHCLA